MIRTVNLSKYYGEFQAVNNVSLRVHPGEIYGFLGPNGAGKTTTILMILGIEKPTSGDVFIFNHDLKSNPFGIKQKLGVLGEQQYFYGEMNATEYLQFFARIYEYENSKPRIDSLLSKVDLAQYGDRRIQNYSRGMKQKLGIVRALVHDPEIIILDEPVSGLDPFGILQIRELLQEENRRGKTILISSHILSEVEQTAHRIGIINNGQLVAEDSILDLKKRIQAKSQVEIELEYVSEERVENILALDFVSNIERDGNVLTLEIDGLDDVRPLLSRAITDNGMVILEMKMKPISLEKAFIRITDNNVEALAGVRG